MCATVRPPAHEATRESGPLNCLSLQELLQPLVHFAQPVDIGAGVRLFKQAGALDIGGEHGFFGRDRAIGRFLRDVAEALQHVEVAGEAASAEVKPTMAPLSPTP